MGQVLILRVQLSTLGTSSVSLRRDQGGCLSASQLSTQEIDPVWNAMLH